MVAGRLHTDVQAAFELVRSYARAHNKRLADVAGEIVTHRFAVDGLRAGPATVPHSA
jgi:hypothetical protein